MRTSKVKGYYRGGTRVKAHERRTHVGKGKIGYGVKIHKSRG